MNNDNNKPFNFWLFMGGIFIGLLVLTALIVGIPYILSK